MRQAIETTYRGPTDHRGSRIIVRARAGRMVVPWDYALEPAENHARAAVLYARKQGWIRGHTEIHGGALPSGGYCFVLCVPGVEERKATEAHFVANMPRETAD